MQKLEKFLEWGGVKKDVGCLVASAAALLVSMFHLIPLPFDAGVGCNYSLRRPYCFRSRYRVDNFV